MNSFVNPLLMGIRGIGNMVRGVEMPDFSQYMPTGTGMDSSSVPTSTALSGITARPVPNPLNVAPKTPEAPDPDSTAPEGLWGKMGGMDGAMSLLSGLGGIWGAAKSYGIMKDSLALNRRAFETNLRNQTQSYNTALEDRAAGRASYNGTSQAETQAYLDRHSLRN